MLHSIPFINSIFSNKLLDEYLSNSLEDESIIEDYISIESIIKSTDKKVKSYENRHEFIELLNQNYKIIKPTDSQLNNFDYLKQNNGFAITSAHQPNLFLGPLYYISKIVSTISLSNRLNQSQSKYNYTPVFVIGTEDHDKEEILNFNLFGENYKWETDQIGPCGEMKLDKQFIELRDKIVKILKSKYNDNLSRIIDSSYQLGDTLGSSTFKFINEMFGKYGLIVVDMYSDIAKKPMEKIFIDEIFNNASNKILDNTKKTFDSQGYKFQAFSRDINLFEIKENRVRITKKSAEIIEKLKSSPNSISPNVILRPLMQQKIIPSTANIGGSSEMLYWLALKDVFNHYKVEYPIVILRDIILPITTNDIKKLKSLNLSFEDIFRDKNEVYKELSYDKEWNEKSIIEYKKSIENTFDNIKTIVSNLDSTLSKSCDSHKVKAINSIKALNNKIIKAKVKKNEINICKYKSIVNKIFPNNVLIERKESFISFYIQHGEDFIDRLLLHSDPLNSSLKFIQL